MYKYTVFCEIIETRRRGLRLGPNDWPRPVLGDLRLKYWDGKTNSLRRTIRNVEIWEQCGTQMRPTIRLVDPVLIDVLGDAMLWRGHVTASTDEGICEYEQVWIVRPRVSLTDGFLPRFDPRPFADCLPETTAFKVPK